MVTRQRPRGRVFRLNRGKRNLGAVLSTALVSASLAACSDPSGTTDPEPSSTSAASDAPEPSAAPTLPPGVVGTQVGWLLAQLAPGANGPPAKAAQERFSSEFLSQAPASEIKELFAQLRASGPFTIVAVAPVTEEDEVRSTSVRLSGAEALVMEVAVDADDRIAGLFFRPDPDATPVPEYDSFDEMSADLDALGSAQVYLGEPAEHGCTTTYESPSADEAAPSGSVFKLLVLSAVVDAVDAGELAWDDEVVVTAQTKSLPSGQLQDKPNGTRVSVREAAGLMIAISDNTATDLLIEAVGKDQISDTIKDLGLADDSLRPLLTTRQLFLLGWGDRDVARGWSDAKPGERERRLEQLPPKLSAVDPASVTSPVWEQGVGWFFTGEEICGMQARLQEQARTQAGEPVREILAENPGVPVPDGVDYLAFKGGSLPGVIALSYLAEPASGPTQVLVVQVRSDTAIDPAPVFTATRGGLALVP